MTSALFKKMLVVLTVAGFGLLFACATTGGKKADDQPVKNSTPESQTALAQSQPSDDSTQNTADAVGTPQQSESEAESTTESSTKQSEAEAVAEQQDEQEIAQQEQATKEAVDLEQQLTQNSGARKDFEDAVMVAGAEPSRAMTLFARAAKEDPGFILAWHNAGVAAERQHKEDQAVAYYKKALALHPDFYPSLNSLVQLYLRRGQLQLASNLIRQTQAKVKTAGVLTVAGQLALAQNKIGEAERKAKAALKLDEKNIPAMLLLAEVFFEQKKFELSRFVLKNGKEIDPKNALIHQALGRVLLAQDKKPAALRAFEQAVSIRQDLFESYNNLSVLYAETGDVEAALSAGKNAVQLSPKNAAAWVNYGNALRAKKMYKEAIAAYQKALSLDKNNPDPSFNLGILYLDNPVDKLDIVQRMDLTLKYLKDYKARARMDEDLAERLDKYIKVAERLKKRELKRRERKAKRKAKEEARKKAELEAKKKAEEEARRKAAEEKARQEALQKAREHKLGGGGK